ncbi:MAG TPA: VIT family protein [Candidatus Saccharimonadales bacterium]|nr:VIT family protein [Candidatus Saccharimonadales bacterium]
MAEAADVERASNSKLNWLRAAVLGANDGIVSVSSIILGVAGATSARHTIFIAGLAGLVAGAFSMAVGEYVSVSSQRDTERAFIAREKRRLQNDAEHELEGLAKVYVAKGLSQQTARQVAKELTATDALAAHLEAELQLDEEDLNNPVHAAFASMVSFTVGGLIPLVAMLAASRHSRVAVTFLAVLLALTVTGYASATVGNAPRRPAIIRVVLGGAAAMALTYLVGHLFGTAVS